ncbi:Polyadenylate-binding protein-interacting protein 4 [Linum perenne]
MSIQQSVQPKSSTNGFNRRRNDREGGFRLENKPQSGKLSQGRSINAIAPGTGTTQVYESPSRDRLVYLTTCLIGLPVEVQLKDGSIYSGTCYTTNVEKEFAIVLKMARLTKDVLHRGGKPEYISKAPSKTLIIPGKDVAQVIAKDVPVTADGLSNELQNERHHDILIDSIISRSHHVDPERELEPWVPDGDDLQCPELENIFDGSWNRGWDQFETNKMLFGVKSTFDEELYTTKLEKGPRMRELEREAMRIAREIEGEETQDLHLAEERGINVGDDFDIDEETRFSSVYRGRGVDDSGYDEDEDILLDKQNTETFGDVSAPFTAKTDLTRAKSNDTAGVLSSSSADEPQCSRSSTGSDLYQANAHEFGRQQADDSLESDGRYTDIPQVSQGDDSIKDCLEEKMVVADAKFSKSGESRSSDNRQTASAYTPSLKSLEKEISSTEPEAVVFGKVVGETSAVNARGQTSSSTSSSEYTGAAPASSCPALSPSSSVGSLCSEKSTLNPNAKEFKFNPNAKSFSPLQSSPLRPPPPVSDGSFYFPTNATAAPQMHGMPMGFGMGSSFSGHQPVMYNPQVASMQPPQAYFHPSGPQYGQQMLLGHPRQVLYMPSYQPDTPYKGR